MNWLDKLSQFWPHLVAGFDFLAALLASIHALLNKRDTRAVTIWIAVVWLIPILGPILYLALGVNRIRRRALSLGVHKTISRPAPENLDELVHDRTGHLQMLARVVNRVIARPLLPGNTIEPLINGDQAFPAMLAAIESATKSVSLCTYIFDNDKSGRKFVAALARAVKRGVAVRVLIDAAGTRYSWPPITWRLRRAGVPMAKFLPASIFTPWRVATVNLRNHRKELVIDGQVAFTGGMNIRAGNVLANMKNNQHTERQKEPEPNPKQKSAIDEYSLEIKGHPPAVPSPGGAGQGEGAPKAGPITYRKGAVQDLHFRVEGPLVAQLQDVFVNDWAFAAHEILDGPIWFPELSPRGDAVARVIRDGPDGDFEKLRWTLLAALAEAQTSVQILTPYFLPDSGLITALSLAALRGVRVDIIMPQENNLPYVAWASRAMWWQVLERGCHIWLTPPPFDHSKLMIVDSQWVLLGSANWDARSLRLNFELNVECYNRDFANKMEAVLKDKLRGARKISLAEADSRSTLIKIRDAFVRLFSPYL